MKQDVKRNGISERTTSVLAALRATMLVAGVTIGLCATALAQQTGGKALTVISEWRPKSIASETLAVSPDGRLLAHFGNLQMQAKNTHASEDKRTDTQRLNDGISLNCGLYLTKLDTGEDKLIVKSPTGDDNWCFAGGLLFSPDGKRILFGASPSREYAGNTYAVHTDGSGLLRLAEDAQLVPDPSDPSGKALQDIAIGGGPYSPDGRKVLGSIYTAHAKRDEQNRNFDTDGKSYVALLSPDGEDQNPEKLVEGRPLFWSTDGKAIYYGGNGSKGSGVYKFDLKTKQSTFITHVIKADDSIEGKVPGADAVFIGNRRNKSVSVINLDGTPVSPELAKTAAAIPPEDSDGRYLSKIQSAGPGQLLLTYEGDDMREEYHSQLVSFQ